MSTGPVPVPLLNVVCWYLGICEFYHITGYWVIPPNLDVSLKWFPEEDDKVQIIFALSFGKPRDLNTGEVVYTDEIGFWHRGRGMKYHWDPLVESIINVIYPHITPTTKQEYFEIRFINRTSRVIIIDVSIWIFEYTRENFERFLSMVRGFSKLLRLADRIVPEPEMLSPEAIQGLRKLLLKP
jgi:hypothetical protein